MREIIATYKAQALEAKWELCRRDLSYFYGYMTGWKCPPHVHKIIDKITNLPDNGKLIVAAPPRHSKSITISAIYPIWLMGRAQMEKQGQRIGLFTYGQAKSNDNSEIARRYVKSPFYQHIFPYAKIENDLVTHWKMNFEEREISYFASSVGGASTGFGYNTVIIDDPHKNWQEARNRTQTQKVYDWYQSVTSTRLEKNAKVILLATRWSDHDLTARLLDTGQFDYISFPAISDDGEPLWDYYGLDYYLDKKEGFENKKMWECIYQQNPIPDEGQIFKREWIFYDQPNSIKRKYITWDTANTTSEAADWSVGIEWGIDENNKIFILDMIRVKREFPALLRLIQEWGTAEDIYIEHAASGVQVLQAMKEISTKRNFIGRNPKLSKLDRLEKHTGKFEAGRVKFTKEFVDLERELLQFPDGSHDDCVDALTLGLEVSSYTETKVLAGDNRGIIESSPYSGIF